MRAILFLKKLVVISTIALLSACGPLIDLPGSGEPPRHFQLSPDVLLPSSAKLNKAVTVYMEDISATGALKTSNIAVQTGSNELKYYQGALWSDRTPILVGRFLSEALASTDNIMLITQENIEIPAKYRMKLDLKEFALVSAGSVGQSTVHIKLSVMLVRNGPLEVISIENFDVSEPVNESDIADVVAGFNKGMNSVAQNLHVWLKENLKKAK